MDNFLVYFKNMQFSFEQSDNHIVNINIIVIGTTENVFI